MDVKYEHFRRTLDTSSASVDYVPYHRLRSVPHDFAPVVHSHHRAVVDL